MRRVLGNLELVEVEEQATDATKSAEHATARLAPDE